MGGRCFKSVEEIVTDEKPSLSTFLSMSREPLLCIVAVSDLVVASKLKIDFIQRQQSDRYNYYSQMAVHGYLVRSQDGNFDKVASAYWLTRADLSIASESLLLGAQDQALRTRAE